MPRHGPRPAIAAPALAGRLGSDIKPSITRTLGSHYGRDLMPSMPAIGGRGDVVWRLGESNMWEGLRSAAAVLLVATIAVLADAQTAVAQQSQYWIWCSNADHSLPDLQIGGCSAVIQSGRESARTLAIVFRNRGIAHKARGEFDRAIEDYSEAIALNPQFADAFLSRGMAYKTKGDLGHAIQDYGHAIQLNPQYADAYDARCYARGMLDQLPAALADCTESLRLLPNTYDTLDSRGLVYLKMGQFDAAIRDYDAALQLNPNIAESLYGRGVAKLNKGSRAAGASDIAAARALNPRIAALMAAYGIKTPP